MATIVLSRVGFEGRHGVTAAERAGTRAFEVDVEVEAPVDAAERSDRLVDTIDYTSIAEILVTIGTAAPHHLLESLAARMVDALLDRFPGSGVKLELRKLQPPACPGHPAYSAVRITRARA